MSRPLRYQTAGESHGPALVAIIDGMPSDVEIDAARVNAELARRQGGYGRGARQKIETDLAEFLGGLRQGRTIGSPIALRVVNRDNRIDDAVKTPPVTRPRPGHADLAGSLKYLVPDCRGTLERASARETAALAFPGRVEDEPAFDSFFDARDRRDAASEAARKVIAGWQGAGALVVATHQVNITALTSVFPRSGEGVVVRWQNGQVVVVGRIQP
jgi:hypothetical protein